LENPYPKACACSKERRIEKCRIVAFRSAKGRSFAERKTTYPEASAKEGRGGKPCVKS